MLLFIYSGIEIVCVLFFVITNLIEMVSKSNFVL